MVMNDMESPLSRAEPTSQSARSAHQNGSETILVVDDYACLGEMAADSLRTSGYHVLTATGGEQAQSIARKTPRIDLLITDLEMPRMRGDELAKWFPAVHPAAKVIFMSSTRPRFPGREQLHLVAKPFRPSDLIAKVRAVLNDAPAPLHLPLTEP